MSQNATGKTQIVIERARDVVAEIDKDAVVADVIAAVDTLATALDALDKTNQTDDPEMPTGILTLGIRLEELERRALAKFLKRVGYDTVLRHTDNSSDREEAYLMIGALEEIRRALIQHGYCPR
jgi:hypothetical protein